MHDMKDPVARAKEHAEKLELIGNNGSVLLGFGLGYLALEMVNVIEEGHLLIICETDPALFKVALEQVDLEPVLESVKVKILVGKEIDISIITALSIKYLTSKISIVKFQPSFSIDPDAYNSLQKRAQETASLIQVNANTILYAGRDMAGNVLANAPDIIRSAGVKRLFDKFKNIPAIVVGAGPSLDKNVTLLKEVKDKAVIISVDRALGLLLPLGITPHLVPSLDYSKTNYDEKYAPLQMDEKLFMVFTQTLYHKITKTFWGPKFSMHMSGSLSGALSHYWGNKGIVSPGMHVGHLAFCMAEAMGCNPIILVGMDLAFTEDKFHAESIETNVPISTSHQTTDEGIFGDMLKSNPSFKSFVIDLNKAIKHTNALCIDATEGGVKKKGARIMRLRDAIDEYCQDDHPEIQRIFEEESYKTDPVKYDELIKDLKFAEVESKKMKKASESTLKIVKKLRKMKEDGQEGSPEYVKLSHKAEKTTLRAGGRGGIMAMLENYNFLNILFMETDKVKRIDEIEDRFEKLDKQLDRAKIYYKNFDKALTTFIQDTQRLSKRLDADRDAQETLQKSPKNWDDYLKYGLELIKVENYTDAETAFKKVIELKPDYGDAYYHLGKIYSEQNRFKTAIPVLKQAIALKSNFTKAKNLLKECRDRNHQWQERCEKITEKSLIDSSQGKDEKEIILEAGNFYFRVKDYKRAEREYLKVIDQYPSLSEAYYHLGHTYFAMKNFDKGVDALSIALELAPNNPAIYRDLGLVSIDRGLMEAAEKFLLKALEFKPNDLELKETLGNIYFNNGTFDKAVKTYEEILATNPDYKELPKTLSIAYQRLIERKPHTREAKV
ncbi:MAG: DUF115 domain-containing protein [Deltaproteobacteria bacterium]|nr:DUF115 domain-containing protein [Deltaproteobacteria bacterium]